MRVITFIGLFVCSTLAAGGDPPPGYYASAEGKAGEDLRQALHLMQSHPRIHAASRFSSAPVTAPIASTWNWCFAMAFYVSPSQGL
jgi:hypothetical protein